MGEDQEETIAFLARPESYGPSVAEVTRIDTHASVVFLAAARAFKLKRAVRYSYLDYSTSELRRIACERELTLNRRTAPELYLRVVPVMRTQDGLRLGGAGKPLDWVVEMVRFDEAELFDRMAEDGRLTDRLMRDLADRIAEFHDGAEIDRRAGGTAAMAKVIEGNELNLRKGSAGFDPARLDRLFSAWRQSLAGVAALLERRRAEGHVRLCHGDLHLRNICLFLGRPTLFDCVEFNDEIARIDVLYDLAFLIMDLHSRQLDRLENQVFNRYLDRRDETGGLAAFPLFLSLRAAIRAHTGAAAATRQPEPERAAAQRREALAYLDAAGAFLASPAPYLLAVGGLSGTGKTSLAYAMAPGLGRAPGARVLRTDVLRKRLMGAAPERQLGPEAYTPAISERVYRLLCAQAGEALCCGQAVVADAVFLKEGERDAIAEVGRTAGVPFVGLWLEAPQQIMERRIRARREDASDATVAVLRRQQNVDKGRIKWLRLDATPNETERIARKARDAIAAILNRSK